MLNRKRKSSLLVGSRCQQVDKQMRPLLPVMLFIPDAIAEANISTSFAVINETLN
jgi:hypothetical protein